VNIDSISDLSRAQIEAAARKRQHALDLKAEQAAGVGQPDEDEFKAEDRQPDGRLPWQAPEEPLERTSGEPLAQTSASDDPSGRRGTNLDISG
jgi:hypothetical protein